jgi:LuxR family maltose regulon positive regulatory protein
MDASLLASKIGVPPLPELIPRPDLIDRLDREIRRRKAVLVAAPAGSGKTSLVAAWAAERRIRTSLLSLSRDENELDRFFRALAMSWVQVDPAIRERPFGMVAESRKPSPDSLLESVLGEAAALEQDHAIVLDDLQQIDDPDIFAMLSTLIDRSPPRLHLVLLTRSDPPLPIAGYRARRTIAEFGSADLAFSAIESRVFLTRLSGFEVAAGDASRIRGQLDGWAAGLVLASMSLQRRGELALDEIGGRQRYVAEYLKQDALSEIPEAIRRFLVETSVLDRLTASLCDAVTKTRKSDEILRFLERQHLFVNALDESGTWFRYQSFFAEFLRSECQRQTAVELSELHRRAGAWYFEQQMPDPAFRHAIAAGDRELTIAVVEQFTNSKLMAGEFRLLEEWVAAIPNEWYSAYPALSLPKAGLLAFTGRFEESLREIARIESDILSVDEKARGHQIGLISAVRCFIACIRNDVASAEALASQALDSLENDALGYRPGIFAALGDTYRRNARWSDAKFCYLTALSHSRAPGVRVGFMHVQSALADLELRQGHLRRAGEHWQAALDAVSDTRNWGKFDLPAIGWVYLRLAELHYEWNELAVSRELLKRGLERSEIGGDARSLVAAYTLSARLLLAEGAIDAAVGSLEQARRLLEHAPFPELSERVDRAQVQCWFAGGRHAGAASWASSRLSDPVSPNWERMLAIRAMLLTDTGRDRDGFTRSLDSIVESAERDDEQGVLIEALTLRAVGHWQVGETKAAMVALERALRLAEPEGYIRLFVELGPTMASLLAEARARRLQSSYVARLIAATEFSPSLGASGQRWSGEALSAREIEVVRLVASGLTNREIADHLSISAETVKKHLASIMGKLGVSNRVAAVGVAREHQMLD